MSKLTFQSTPDVPSHTTNFPLLPTEKKRSQLNIEAHIPALLLDEEGTLLHLTPAARRLLEYKPDQNVDSYFFSHVHGKNLNQVMRDLADMVRRGKDKASWLLRMRTGQGHWRWYRALVKNHLHQPTSAITVKLRDLYKW